MKYILVALFLLFSAPAVLLAYNPQTIIVEEPFEIIQIPMDEAGQKQSYLGTLTDYPHLYQFSIDATTTMEVQVRQRVADDAQPVNLIVLSVQPETQRISEVVRLNTTLAERVEERVSNLGVSLYVSELLEIDLTPGLYRLEVSTSLNEGPYELNFGAESVDNTYFGTFGTIWQVQQHFGYSWARYFYSSFILYQLGILVMIGGFAAVWYLRKRQNQTTIT